MAEKEIQGEKEDVRIKVRDYYGSIADGFEASGTASCCAPAEDDCGCSPSTELNDLTMVSKLYETPEVATLPEDVVGLSLGCGDPVTLASLEPGQTVLDLGSGGGIDCFLAAKQVGESGRVIGIDMTPAMIEKARANKQNLGADNVEFRLGEIEHIPAANETVDVVISNCVINLSPDKPQVFREAFRILRPGGRLAVSDIVTDGPLPSEIKNNLNSWASCVAGALDAKDYVAAIEAAGFVDVELRSVQIEDSLIEGAMGELDSGSVQALGGESVTPGIFTAKVTARKPESHTGSD
jgi:SAM-dependent methyltransferase